jgi:hypothetical protein
MAHSHQRTVQFPGSEGRSDAAPALPRKKPKPERSIFLGRSPRPKLRRRESGRGQ